MENQRFDQVTKGLAHPASRRTAARALAVGALGVALTRLVPKRHGAAAMAGHANATDSAARGSAIATSAGATGSGSGTNRVGRHTRRTWA